MTRMWYSYSSHTKTVKSSFKEIFYILFIPNKRLTLIESNRLIQENLKNSPGEYPVPNDDVTQRFVRRTYVNYVNIWTLMNNLSTGDVSADDKR